MWLMETKLGKATGNGGKEKRAGGEVLREGRAPTSFPPSRNSFLPVYSRESAPGDAILHRKMLINWLSLFS